MTNSAPSLTRSDEALLRSYRAAPLGGYDELTDADGAVRPHWQTLLAGLADL